MKPLPNVRTQAHAAALRLEFVQHLAEAYGGLVDTLPHVDRSAAAPSRLRERLLGPGVQSPS